MTMTITEMQELTTDANEETLRTMLTGLLEILKTKCVSLDQLTAPADGEKGNDTVATESDACDGAHDNNDERGGIDSNEADGGDSGIDDDTTTSIAIRDSPTEASDNNDKVKKRNNARPDWFLVTTFTNAEDFDAYIKQETFSIQYTVNLKSVRINYMRCKLVRKKGPQCEARLCVRISSSDVTWVVLTNGRKHTHEQIKNKSKPKRKEKAKPKKYLPFDGGVVASKEPVCINPNIGVKMEPAAMTEEEYSIFIKNEPEVEIGWS